MSKRKYVSRSKIVDYWINTDEGVNQVKAIKKITGSYPSFVHIDLDCPECFACASPIKSKAKENETWNKIWNQTKLEAAHIVPHSKGGESIPSNLILLCRDCHRENPDSSNETFFWKWICSRPHYTVQRLKALEQIPLSQEQLSNLKKYIDPINQTELNDLVQKVWKAVDPVTVSGKYSTGSIVEMIHYAADNCKQLKDPLKSGDQMELF